MDQTSDGRCKMGVSSSGGTANWDLSCRTTRSSGRVNGASAHRDTVEQVAVPSVAVGGGGVTRSSRCGVPMLSMATPRVICC